MLIGLIGDIGSKMTLQKETETKSETVSQILSQFQFMNDLILFRVFFPIFYFLYIVRMYYETQYLEHIEISMNETLEEVIVDKKEETIKN